MQLYINDKPSNIDEVSTLIGIKKTEVPLHIKSRHFERLGVRGKRDPQNNKPVVPRGHGVPCSIKVTAKNGEVATITYSENKKTEHRNGVSRIVHTPINLMLPGLTLSIREDEHVKFFFLFIHPYNKVSPLNIGKSNPHCVYEFQDTEKAAKAEIDKDDLFVEAMLALKNLGDTEVIQIAKGYKMPGIDNLKEPEVRLLLRNKLKENPSQFLINLSNNEIAIEGIIQDAIDKGIITHRLVGTSKIWSISDKELCISQPGISEILSIRGEVESNLDVYMPLLLSKIETKAGASNLKKPDNDKWFSAHQGKPQDPNQISNLGIDDKAFMASATKEQQQIEKLRAWAKLDILNPDLNTNTKKAIVNNGEAILEQFRKDKGEGLIPEETPEPVVVLPS